MTEKLNKQIFNLEKEKNIWDEIKGCYFNNNINNTLYGYVVRYKTYTYFVPCKPHISVNRLPPNNNVYCLNFDETNSLEEFEHDCMFVKFLIKAISFLEINKISYTVDVNQAKFINTYNKIITTLKENKFADATEILVNDIMYVNDTDMKMKVDYFRKLKHVNNEKIIYRDVPLQKEINKYDIQLYNNIYFDKNIKNYIYLDLNNNKSNIQFLKFFDNILIIKIDSIDSESVTIAEHIKNIKDINKFEVYLSDFIMSTLNKCSFILSHIGKVITITKLFNNNN